MLSLPSLVVRFLQHSSQATGAGNTVSVGDGNTGNIAGRDIKLK